MNAGRNRPGEGAVPAAPWIGARSRTDARSILLSLAYVEVEPGAPTRPRRCASRPWPCRTSTETRGLASLAAGAASTANAGNGDAAHSSAFDQALALLDGPPSRRRRLCSTAETSTCSAADDREARDDFVRATQIAAAAGLEVIRAKAEHNLGYTRMLARGHRRRRWSMMDEARPMLDRLSPMYRAACEQDRAEVLVAAGLSPSAEDALERRAKAYGSRRLRQRQAEASSSCQNCCCAQDPRGAGGRPAGSAPVRAARQRTGHCGRRGSASWPRSRDQARTIPVLDAHRRPGARPRRARTDAATRRSLALQGGPARRGSRRPRRTRRAARRLRLDGDERLTTRLLHREMQAMMSARQASGGSARTDHVRAGLAELHDWQSTFGSLDLQSSLVGHGRGLALQGSVSRSTTGGRRSSSSGPSERGHWPAGHAGAAADRRGGRC